MTDEQRSEIERLAGEAYDKAQVARYLSMANMPTDPEKAREQSIRYEMALVEARVAAAALKKASDIVASS